MVSETIETQINDQIQAEIYSSYLYLQMSAWLDEQGLKGMSRWMDIQTQEEWVHAMKLYRYLLERGGTVVFQAIQAPPSTWASPLAAFQQALEHERMVTGRINALVDLAIEERDHATRSVLQWFVDEQVEEESNAEENVRLLTMSDGNPQATFMIDQQMLGRPEMTPPVV
jgi:ferritin